MVKQSFIQIRQIRFYVSIRILSREMKIFFEWIQNYVGQLGWFKDVGAKRKSATLG